MVQCAEVKLLAEIRDMLASAQSDVKFLSIPEAARVLGVDKEYIRGEMNELRLKFCLWGNGCDSRKKERKTTVRWIREWQDSIEEVTRINKHTDMIMAELNAKIEKEHVHGIQNKRTAIQSTVNN